MAKVLATEIRIGHLLEWEKRIWRVIKCYHVHVGGRGGAFMQVEMKDIESGTKTNQRIRTEDKVERAFVDPREMQYLYNDGTGYVFMDKENYEQLTLSDEMLEGQTGYLLPGAKTRVPERKNLHFVAADPVVEIVVNSSKMNAPDSLRLGVQRRRSDSRLRTEQRKRFSEFILEGLGSRRAIPLPPDSGPLNMRVGSLGNPHSHGSF